MVVIIRWWLLEIDAAPVSVRGSEKLKKKHELESYTNLIIWTREVDFKKYKRLHTDKILGFECKSKIKYKTLRKKNMTIEWLWFQLRNWPC